MKIKKKVKAPVSVYNQLPSIVRPSFADTLVFPDDITELEAANISELHGKYSLMYSYVNQDLARLTVRMLQLQTKESLTINGICRANRGLNTVERWKRDTILGQDSDVEMLRAEMAKIQQAKVFAEMYLSNYEKYLNALSRELTRKTAETTRFGKNYTA